MDDLLPLLMKIREVSNRVKTDLSNRFSCPVTDAPLDAFGMCFNTATVIAESISYFNQTWSALDAQGVRATQRQHDEAVQRVLLLTKMLFVFALSAFEHSAKAATEKFPIAVPLDKKKKWQYLSNILGKSHDLGIVSGEQKLKWDAIITLRNTLVHNNGIASEDLKMMYPNGAIIDLKSGVMAWGDILLFPRLLEWMIESYASWSEEFLKRAGSTVA